MRFWIVFFIGLTAALHANHPANVLEKLGDYTPVLTFTESVAQRIVGPANSGDIVDNYSASFRVVVGAETFAFDASTIVRLRISDFLLDTTLGAASDYTAGGNHATFLIGSPERIGFVKAKWGDEKLVITGSIKSRLLPPAGSTFLMSQLTEDAGYFINQATDASLSFGDLSGSRRVEVKGQSSVKNVRIGPEAEDLESLWKVTVAGGLDFTAPKVKLLSPGTLSNATPQRYILSTSPDVEFVGVGSISSGPPTDPVAQDEDPSKKSKARLWDGLLYLEAGANAVEFTATDRSGNATVVTYTLNHDWRCGVYSATVDAGSGQLSTLVLNVGRGGAFTGTLQLGAEQFRFKEVFDENGVATFQARRPKGGASIDIQLALEIDDTDFTAEPDPKPTYLNGFITDNGNTFAFDASRAVFDTETIQAAALAGYYTAFISPDSADGPEGDGILSMKLSADGKLRTVGKLADGTAFTASGLLGGDGRFLIGKRLYARAGGFLQGFITFSGVGSNRCSGLLRWVRPPEAAKAIGLFHAGFSTDVTVDGGIYKPGRRDPDEGDTTPLGIVTEVKIAFQLGDFGDTALERDFDVDYRGAVRILSAAPEDKLKLAVRNKTGTFTGSIRVDGHTSPSKKFFGIFDSELNTGKGAFLSKSDAGAVTIEAR